MRKLQKTDWRAKPHQLHARPIRTAADLQQHRIPEAAAILGLSPKTLWAWVYARKVTVSRVGGSRSVRIGTAEIERLIEEGMTPARVA